jgi:para-aminobenzoate synthetase/4-amino-4-deoxychorismate lyase
VTGAPKLAAMDVISELESAARQAFCGAIGFASPTAGLELSVAIRTFECAAGHAWLDVGGGVVADSDPDAEAAEALDKARPLLAAIGARIAVPEDDAVAAGDAAALRPPRLAAHPVPRPDPAAGVFETLLVADGVPVALDEHLARLAAAVDDLYALELPDALGPLVRHTALEHGGPCRLRVLVDPDGQVGLQVAPLPPEANRHLVAVVVPGGLGDRKWRDRRLIDALEESVAPALPLLVDLDGHVLETTRANVLAWIDDALVTPPLDGRILPGVTRARALAAAHAAGLAVQERPLALRELHDAHGVLVTGALRGVQPVATLDGARLCPMSDHVRTLVARFPPL